MFSTFNVGVKALISNKNKFLLLKEIDFRDDKTVIYDLPGGRIEKNESIEECLARELYEELGLSKFKIGKLLNAFIHPKYINDSHLLLLLFYLVDIDDLKIKLSNEHVGYEWVTKAEFQKLVQNKAKIHQGIKDALEIAFK